MLSSIPSRYSKCADERQQWKFFQLKFSQCQTKLPVHSHFLLHLKLAQTLPSLTHLQYLAIYSILLSIQSCYLFNLAIYLVLPSISLAIYLVLPSLLSCYLFSLAIYLYVLFFSYLSIDPALRLIQPIRHISHSPPPPTAAHGQ